MIHESMVHIQKIHTAFNSENMPICSEALEELAFEGFSILCESTHAVDVVPAQARLGAHTYRSVISSDDIDPTAEPNGIALARMAFALVYHESKKVATAGTLARLVSENQEEAREAIQLIYAMYPDTAFNTRSGMARTILTNCLDSATGNLEPERRIHNMDFLHFVGDLWGSIRAALSHGLVGRAMALAHMFPTNGERTQARVYIYQASGRAKQDRKEWLDCHIWHIMKFLVKLRTTAFGAEGPNRARRIEIADKAIEQGANELRDLADNHKAWGFLKSADFFKFHSYRIGTAEIRTIERIQEIVRS